MVAKTHSRSPAELAMTRSTSEVAFCSSDASLSSRLSRAIFAVGLGAAEWRRRAGFGARLRFGAVFRRRGSSPALECRRIASPEALDAHRSESDWPSGSGWLPGRRRRRRLELPQRALAKRQESLYESTGSGDDAQTRKTLTRGIPWTG